MSRGRLRHSALRVTSLFVWDGDLFAHAWRVMRLAQSLATFLDLSLQKRTRLVRAALLHDLGKWFIPETILYKAGPLTEEEWAIMRRHPQIGSSLLLKAGGQWADLAPVVLAHHERWDGRGYPYGLPGEQIPLEARILAVADAYDAMISSRVYRQALSPAEARDELQNGAGSQFDPHVVAAFLEVLEREECAHGAIPGMY
jgi:HD-GYP domain-containing protein (c-di-GMP phosphodiesterase class II)